MMNVKKIFNTVRYMTFRQWRYRLYYTIRNKLIKRKAKCGLQVENITLLPLNYRNAVCRKDVAAIADDICENKIPTVSGIIKEFDGKIDWDLAGEDYRLVCFKLNSFKWLLNLSDAYKATLDHKYLDKGFELIDDWHRYSKDRISGDKWNPYVIAERLMNWIGFCSEYSTLLNRDINIYAVWIAEQAAELKSSLEYHLGANHLLSEGKALIGAGVFLNNEDFIKCGNKLLRKEIDKQFLPDGGHYERSVSYHVESLQQYFETIIILSHIKAPQVGEYIRILREPYNYLNGMIGASGEIPLFNDAALDYPFYNAADFLATGGILFTCDPPNARQGEYFCRWNICRLKKQDIEWKGKKIYESTGYIHHRFKSDGKEYSLFFDAADCGPDFNMGHAHADALEILMLSDTKDIFADSGVFTYKSGKERDYCRATRAHNTIEIDGADSAEMWSAFRVARRGHTRILEYKESEDKTYIKALHDGYTKCLKTPTVHIRSIDIQGKKIKIEDQIVGEKGHNAVSRFHIGPKCSITQTGENACRIDGNIILESTLPIQIVGCEIAERFGITETTKCVEIPFSTKVYSTLITTIFVTGEREDG